MKFFDWAFVNGDKMADDLDYVPLPAAVKDLVRKQWTEQIKDTAGKRSPSSKPIERNGPLAARSAARVLSPSFLSGGPLGRYTARKPVRREPKNGASFTER